MRRVASAVLAALLLASCGEGSAAQPPGPTQAASATASQVDIDEHESGPQSPIAYGFFVPDGATQLGPLLRLRSPGVIAAFEPLLLQAVQEQAVLDARADARANPAGVPSAAPPTIPQVREPADDSFDELDDPPNPDVTFVAMRADSDPGAVLRELLWQMSAVLPGVTLNLDDLRQYCTVRSGNVTGCRFQRTGLTSHGARITVTVTADVGNVATRTAPAASEGRPILTLTVRSLDDPLTHPTETGEIDTKHTLAPMTRAPHWLRETAAPDDTPIYRHWRLPQTATLLLSGTRPRFAAAVTRRGQQADDIAQSFAAQAGGTISKDVVEELNEVRTTYSAATPGGERLIGSYVLSARGNYVLLWVTR